jgi:hypothetical protein
MFILVSILCQMNPLHAPFHFYKILFNIILLSTPEVLHVVSSLRVLLPKLYALLLSPMCATCPAHLIFLDFIILTTFGED